MNEYADLSHMSVIDLIQLRYETVKANFPEDKDFVIWIDKELKKRDDRNNKGAQR